MPVVRLGAVRKHPNADSLSITDVDGCPVVFRTADLREGDLAVYVPVDAVVTKGKCAPLDFLPFKPNGTHRVRAAKLRGVFSMGILWPCSAIWAPGEEPGEGSDLGPVLGIIRYEEPEDLPAGTPSATSPPDGKFMPVYDLKSYRKYKRMFYPGEYVAVTEKVHGCNARFLVDDDGCLHVGSHNRWIAVETKYSVYSVWWRAAATADLATKLQHPDVRGKLGFYGEVYGQVQDLRYGVQMSVRVAMFDILDLRTKMFLSYPEFLAVCAGLGLKTVPCLGTFQHDEDRVFALAEGESELAADHGGKHVREGVVVRPLVERQADVHGQLQRVCYKLHGQGFLLRKGGTEHH